MNPNLLIPAIVVSVQPNFLDVNNSELFGPIKPFITEEPDELDRIEVFAQPISTFLNTKVFNKLLSRIIDFSKLEKNWDGNNSSEISSTVIANALTVLSFIPDEFISYMNEDDIFPSPYGTVFIEFENEKKELQLEIGEGNLSYFLEEDSNVKLDTKISMNNFLNRTNELINAFNQTYSF